MREPDALGEMVSSRLEETHYDTFLPFYLLLQQIDRWSYNQSLRMATISAHVACHGTGFSDVYIF